MGLFDILKDYTPPKPLKFPHYSFVNKFHYSEAFQVRLNLGPLKTEEYLKLLEFFESHLGDLEQSLTRVQTAASEGTGLNPQQVISRLLWNYSKEFEGKRFSPVKEDDPAYAEFYLSGDLRRKGRADRMKTGDAARKLIENAVRDKLAVEFVYSGKKGESQKPHWVNLRDSDERGFRGYKAHGVRRFNWSKVLSARLMDNAEGKLSPELVLMLDFSTDPETPPVRLTLTKLLSEDRILGLDPTVKSE